MMRWVLAVALLQLACLSQGTRQENEARDTHADGEVLQEIAEPAETSEPDADPEASVAEPCIATTPTRIAFGASEIGTSSIMTLSIRSCGNSPLVIDAVSITNDGGGVFAVEGAVGRMTLEPGATTSVAVSFTPKMAAGFDASGNVVQTEGALSIVSNAGAVTVPLEGFGRHFECPVAVITVAEGEEVLPGTNLSLSGASSVATGGATSFEWSVEQPNGSVSTFLPSSGVVSPRFEVNVVGQYIFRLTVRDRFGTASCAPAEYTVMVAGDDSITVELIWDTPGDPNQQDTSDPFDQTPAGSDVDLHFLHPIANGKLFDGTFDCYFANPNPNWGEPGTFDDPRLERDDSDGAGPEYLTLKAPEDGARYQVSVHYYDDWGYGDSEVTLRVYVYGILRDEWSATLTRDDQWDAQYIDWPSGVVTRIGEGAPRITPDVSINRPD